MKERSLLEKMYDRYAQKKPTKKNPLAERVTLNGVASTPTPCQIERYLEEVKKQNGF